MPQRQYTRTPRPALYPISASIAYIPLSQGVFAKVLTDHAEFLSQFRWHAQHDSHTTHAYTILQMEGHRIRIAMHRAIAGLEGDTIDHSDRDGTNNIPYNLRPATKSQNRMNSKRSDSNTSGFKGVCREYEGWVARIGISGRRHRLGVFDSPEKAYAAYCEAAQRLHGEFARLD